MRPEGGPGTCTADVAPARRIPACCVSCLSMPPTPHRAETTTLSDLLAVLPRSAELHATAPDRARELAIRDVTNHTRDAGPGVLFACRPGLLTDGHDFGPAAVAAGSPALLVERILDVGVPQLQVESVAGTLGEVAATVHGHPSAELALAGVTGTNGKTTVTYLLEAILAAAGHTTGVIGTVATRIAGETVAGARTTPEAPDLQRLLRRMVGAGVSAAAMEVSSHGLALGRVTGTRFAVAMFTNLSQDHLDFHSDVEAYFDAKAALFTPRFAPVAVVNVDDRFGQRLAGETPLRVVRVGSGRDAHVTARDVASGPDGSTFTAVLHGRSVTVRTALPGHFNVTNALCALAAAEVVGVAPEVAAAGIATLSGVPGRMERVDAGQPFTVLVDYAHTPDSLQNVLQAARALVAGQAPAADGARAQVIVVIGCGGDRDRGKRPLMGRAAAEGADLAVLTSDNPRSEDPLAILDAMAAGARGVPGARHTVEPSRRGAIALALDHARPGDVVVIAGKGHETSQELADRVVAFDDRAVARELLAGGTVRP